MNHLSDRFNNFMKIQKKKKKKIIISQRCNFTIRKLFTFCPRQNLLERILRENHGN